MEIKIQYHHESEGWWAESPDAPGFTAAAPTFNEVREQARAGVSFHLERDDLTFAETGVPTVSQWSLSYTVTATNEYVREVLERSRHAALA